jgi:hypothetical protein
MNFAIRCRFRETRRDCLASLSGMRIVFPLILVALALGLPGVCQAKETCPWLNQETAAGFLGGNEVAKILGSSDSFASYIARCGPHATPLRAIGNEAVACGFDGKKNQVSEQVVSRVRGRGFIVRITANSDPKDRGALREKARNVAEQVAGFLF